LWQTISIDLQNVLTERASWHHCASETPTTGVQGTFELLVQPVNKLLAFISCNMFGNLDIAPGRTSADVTLDAHPQVLIL
jgi:hypothetical protein